MKKFFHYSFLICLCCGLIFLICGGLTSTAFGVYLPYLMEETGCSNTEINLINSCRSFAAFGAKLVCIAIFTKLKARKMTALACGLCAAAFFTFAFAPNLIFYYVAGVLLGLSNGLGTMILCSVILRRWFKIGIGTVLGIVASCTAIAGAVVPPLVTAGVASMGVSKTMMIEGIIVVVLAALIILFLRNEPADMGLTAFGEGQEEVKKEKKPAKSAAKAGGFLPKKEILFVMVAAFMVGATNCYNSVNSLVLKEIGLEATSIAAVLSVYGTTLLFGKFGFGVLNDIFGGFVTNLIFTLCFTAGLGIILLWTPSLPLIMVATILISLGMTLCSTSLSTWAADLTKKEDYDASVGKFQSSFAASAMILSFLPGPIADLTGSYRPAVMIFFIMSLLIIALILRAYAVNARLAKKAAEDVVK